jgi:ferredoxin hydrogenase large subunit
MIKAQNPDAITVFIGPCIAKKSEVLDQQIAENADYVLTYSEIRAIMRAKDVKLEPDSTSYQESSVFGKRFGNSGGVTAAVVESLKEMEAGCDPKVCQANGAAECKKALLLMKVGKLPEDFIEGMACEGGCVGGPSSYNDMMSTKKFRDELIAKADDRTILGNLEDYKMDTFSMHRE